MSTLITRTSILGLSLLSLAAAAQPVAGRYVRCRIERDNAILTLAEVEVFENGKNVARGAFASQSSIEHEGTPERAIDGNPGRSWGDRTMTHTKENAGREHPWWELDLQGTKTISAINLWNRPELADRLNGVEVMVLDEARVVKWSSKLGRAKPTKNAFTVDTGNLGPLAGERVPDGGQRKYRVAAKGAELMKLYEKRATWMETLVALAAKEPDFGSPKPLLSRLFADFPETAGEIVMELEGGLLDSRRLATGYPGLAQEYAKRLYDERLSAEWLARAPQVKTADELAKLRAVYRADRALGTRLQHLIWFNDKALERAIKAYAEKYPQAYANKDALLAELAAVKPLVAAAKKGPRAQALAVAAAVEKLTDAIYLKHPAVDFQKILMVRRNRMSPSGLPHNWQGNSSVPLQGYVNDIVAAPLKQTDGTGVQELVASTAFLGDVDLDFDAQKIAYSAGVPNERGWRIMETPLAKPMTQTQLSPRDQPDIDCYDPCYLPDGRMLFVATSGFHGVPCVSGSDYVGNTHLRELDGSVKRLVFDQDNSWCPVVMNNGRVLYLRWEYTDSAHYFSRVMMTMNPDGSDQKAFYGSNSYWPNSLFYARPLPGSVTKFCGIVSGHHGHAREGELVLFDVTKGRNETGGVMQRIPGWGKPVQNKARDTLVNPSHPLFLHPFPVSDELFLVAFHQNAGEPFMIAFADIYDNIVPLWRMGNLNLLEPVPVAARKKPIVSINRRNDDTDKCTVFLQSAEFGEGLKGVPRGTAKKLRLFQYSYSPRNKGGHYVIGFEGPWDARSIIGEVDLEADGSCLFTAPANTPLAIQPLDANGHKLQEMRSWFVGVPGETISCTGCHENQNEAPPAALPIAARKKPQTPKSWFGPRRNYAFEREVQPVLDAKCVGCHNSKSTQTNHLGQRVPNLEGTRGCQEAWGFSVAYFNLMPYVRRNGPEGDYHLLTPLEFHVDTSELKQMLDKGHHGVQLTAEEYNRLTTWMDLNVPFYGTWSERFPNDSGVAHNLARRREMAEKWAGDKYDPEKVVNPYKPGTVAFTPPPRKERTAVKPPAVVGWPFDAAKARAMQGEKPFDTLDLGNGEKLTLARIPAGSFPMGSTELTPAEQPVSKVTIEKPFWMATCEITQGQMRLMDPSFDNGVYDMHYKDQVKRGYYMGNQDPDFAQKGHEHFPAIRVSWQEANRFCEWLSRKTGRKVRLPSEAQWEWACRAGTETPMNYGGWNDDFSKHENLADYMFIELAVVGVNPQPITRGTDRNPRRRPNALMDYELRDRRFNDGVLHLAKVGSYAPNAWGLKDMHGNVAEWTRSPWKAYPVTSGDDAAAADGLKVVRGGSWYRRQLSASSASRWRYPVWMRPFDVGFRIIVED